MCEAQIALCEGMKAELRTRVIEEFARAYGEGAPQTYPCARCGEGTVYREKYLCRACSND